ncbi:MAG: hypothetical protein IPK10_15100 [Bacteroidetes bacterium]|nr:hypothetical protein [Bacteroidota bacterium]
MYVPLATRNIHWAFAAGTSYLPLEWGAISANAAGKDVNVKWTTFSEKNTDYFTVYKSVGNSNFVDIGTVTAAGNSNEVKQYALLDKNSSLTSAYYKVKETDLNGDEFWSDIVF